MQPNYREMSDFEVNCAVARALAFEPMMFFDVDRSFCRGPVWNVASGVTEEGIKVSRGNAFNPCASWADAGPIIQQNEIDILWNWSEDGIHGAAAGFPFRNYEDANPLRAAMVVFLMMQGIKAGE